MEQKELMHHGIKGQRWGFRKDPDEKYRIKSLAREDKEAQYKLKAYKESLKRSEKEAEYNAQYNVDKRKEKAEKIYAKSQDKKIEDEKAQYKLKAYKESLKRSEKEAEYNAQYNVDKRQKKAEKEYQKMQNKKTKEILKYASRGEDFVRNLLIPTLPFDPIGKKIKKRVLGKKIFR